MFPDDLDARGHAGEREDRALLPPARGGGGGGADGDAAGAGAPPPGCLGLLVGWRRRRSRISSTTGAKDLQEQTGEFPRQQVLKELPRQQVLKELPLQGAVAEIPAELPKHQRVTTDGTKTEGEAELKELPTDVDCLIISKLMSWTDRCSLENVSHSWRSSTRQCINPPLPLIANADFTISNCFANGLRSAPLAMNSRVPHPPGHEVTCLGSLGNWAVFAYDEWNPEGDLALPHSLCYLIHPMKGNSFILPSPCSSDKEAFSGSLQIVDGNGQFTFYQPVKTSSLRLKKVVLSQSSSPADSNIVGLATQRGEQHIVFSTPGMLSWYICSAEFITVGSDIEFLNDKVIILGNNQESIFQIDFGPNMSYFPVLCEVRMCMALELPEIDNTHRQLNLVRSSGGGLLLVSRYFTLNWEELTAVRVFQLDPSNWTWQEIESLGAFSILISLSSSQSISAPGQSDPKADHIYFLDQFCPNFLPGENDNFSYRSQVYSLKDGTVSELLIGRRRGNHRPGFPMWFFPAE